MYKKFPYSTQSPWHAPCPPAQISLLLTSYISVVLLLQLMSQYDMLLLTKACNLY